MVKHKKTFFLIFSFLINFNCNYFDLDLFAELVPVPVHQALAAYEVRKTEIVNTEIARLRESTQVLNGFVNILLLYFIIVIFVFF